MPRLPFSLARLRRDRRGVTVVEFALIILPLTVTLLVLFDFSYRMYAEALLEGTLHRASRLASVGGKSTTEIDDFVRDQLKTFSRSQPPEITRRSYYQFSGVGKEESYVDANNNGKYDLGECYVDENQNNKWDDATTSGTTGTGGSDDIVYYTVTITFPRLFPLGKFLGWAAQETVSANTVLRNQPYGSQAQLPKCAS